MMITIVKYFICVYTFAALHKISKTKYNVFNTIISVIVIVPPEMTYKPNSNIL